MDALNPNPMLPSGPDSIESECESLRHLVVSVLILVIVVSGTLNIFFLRQLKDARRELNAIRPQAAQMMGSYQKTEMPMMQSIIAKFSEYGRTHADYAPILAKYGINPSGTGGTNPPQAGATGKK